MWIKGSEKAVYKQQQQKSYQAVSREIRRICASVSFGFARKIFFKERSHRVVDSNSNSK